MKTENEFPVDKKTKAQNKIYKLRKRIGVVNEREKKSEGLKIKDKRGGNERIKPGRNAQVVRMENKIRDLEREKKTIGNKERIEELKKEIEELNKREQQSYKMENFKFKDSAAGVVESDVEKMVLEKEAEIRKLENEMAEIKKEEEKEEKNNQAEYEKTASHAQQESSASINLSEEDLNLRKQEIYQDGDNHTEQNAGEGQFEYRISPENGAGDEVINENLKKLEELRKEWEEIQRKKEEALKEWREKEEENKKSSGIFSRVLGIKNGMLGQSNEEEMALKQIYENLEKDGEELDKQIKTLESLETRKEDSKEIIIENNEVSGVGVKQNVYEPSISETVKKANPILAEEDLNLRKQEIYQDGDNHTEQNAGEGQFEYRISPENGAGDAGQANARPDVLASVPAKLKRKTNIINLDEIVKGAAWRQAEERVRELLHSPEEQMTSNNRRSSILNNISAVFRHPVRFLQKAWVRMAEAEYREKYYREILDQITNNQNLMVELERSYRLGRPLNSSDPDLRRDAHFEVLAKVLEEYSNNAVEMEEQGNRISDPRVDERFQRLIYAYQKSSLEGREWSREKFERVQRRYINSLKRQGFITNADFLGAGLNEGMRSEAEVGEGRMYATNIFDIAQDYKNHLNGSVELIAGEQQLSPEQKELLRNHIQSTLELDINLGAKLSDVANKRPAGTFSCFDRAIGWMQRTPILRRIASNPGSMAIVAAVGSNFLSRSALRLGATGVIGVTGLVTGAWIPVIAGSIAAGTFGAIRRNRELKNDRAMFQRQKTMGREHEGFRNSNLERFQYDIRSSADLNQELDSIIAAANGSYDNLSNNQRHALASIFSRFKVELARDREFRQNGEDRTVDLISAAGLEEGERYNTHYVSKTDLKIKLYNFLSENGLIDETKRPIRGDFSQMVTGESAFLLNNINNADAAFDGHRRRSALTVGAIAGVSGAIGVFAGQEIGSRVLHRLGFGERVTAYDTIFNRDKLNQINPSIQVSKPVPDNVLGALEVDPNGSISHSGLPKGWKFVDDANGTRLIHEINQSANPSIRVSKPVPDNVLAGLEFRKDGSIDPSNLPKGWKFVDDAKGMRLIHEGVIQSGPSVYSGKPLPQSILSMITVDKNGAINASQLPSGWRLEGSGKNVSLVYESIQGGTNARTVDVGLEDYIKKHEDMFTRIKRGIWGDNDTPKFDKNELKMHWGGENGTGIDKNGNYVLNMKHMTPDGSYHKGTHWNPQELVKQGKLKLLISLSEGTQNQVVEVPINANGDIVVDPNSEIGKAAFKVENGKASFMGRFAEVAVDGGKKDGIKVFNSLATLEGKGINSMKETIPGTDPTKVVERFPLSVTSSGEEGIIEEIPIEYTSGTGGTTEEIPIKGMPGKKFETPWAIGPAGASRWQLEGTKRKEKPIINEKDRLPIFDRPVSVSYYENYNRYSGKDFKMSNLGNKDLEVKQYFSNVDNFKPILTESQIKSLKENNLYSKELEYILERIEKIRNSKNTFNRLYNQYKKQYDGDISAEDFESKIVDTYMKMARNILLEKAKIGEKPFGRDFYEKSPIINGINNAEEIVVMYDPPLGDTILDVPIITCLERYLKANNLQGKEMVIVTKYPELFQDFSANNAQIRIISDKNTKGAFDLAKRRYIINDNKGFRDPSIFGLTNDQFKDEAHVLNFHYSSWALEQAPEVRVKTGKTRLKFYYPIPLRVIRNMELLLGTKLFEKIDKLNSFWPPVHNFEQRNKEKRQELSIGENDPILTVSFGSSIVPKEYEPKKWLKVIDKFMETASANTQIVFVRDLNDQKAEKYQKEVIDKIPDEYKNRIRVIQMNMSEAPLIMKMSKVFLSPDTGLGHLASSQGTTNILLHINNPLLWSSTKSRQVSGESSKRAFRQGERDYGEAWGASSRFTDYLVQDRTGKMEGASNIKPERIVKALNQSFSV